MSIVIHFVLGFIISFLGMITPSMLNMTAAKISLNKNKQEAIKFALGVSLMVIAQAYLAILFTKFLSLNPGFVLTLQKISIVIFAGLSFYFFQQSIKEKKNELMAKESSKNSLIVGLFLSALNMFSIPFYCGVTSALDMAGWLMLTQQNMITFVVGSAFGTFLLLYLYAEKAKFIQKKAKGLAKNLNLTLSILTGVIALITLIKVL